MAKTKPLPPDAEIRSEAIAVIRNAGAPLTAKQVAGLLAMGRKIPEATLQPILEECASTGLLHPFAPATAKGKARFWDRDQVEWGRVQIENAIRKSGPQPVSKLKAAAKGLNVTQFQQALQSLIEARRILEHPPVGTSRTLKYGTELPECEPYLRDVSKTLSKIVRQLIEAGVDRVALARTIWVRLNEMGLSLPENPDSSEGSVDASVAVVDLLTLIRQIEPGADRGALMTARDLRRAANLEKRQFDELVLDLARQGRLMLHRHDHASSLSPAERDELVTDGAGAYYVGMALRRQQD